jgi:hypothetical protein
MEESTSSPPPVPKRPNPSPIQRSYLDQLRTDFNSKSSPQLTTATFPTHSRTNNSSSSTSSVFTILKRKTSNLNPQPTAKKRISFALDLPAEPKVTILTKIPATSNQSASLPNIPPPAEELCLDAEIHDLCSALKDIGPKATRLGYLSDQENQRHELRCLTEEVAGPASVELISLGKLLATDGHVRLTRQKRYKIACILASSLLQLQTTPWLRGNLTKNDIFFYHWGSEVLDDQPYISHSFLATKNYDHSSGNTASEAQSHAPPRTNLSSLGILLLELCWGQAIENQTELRKKHLSSDGRAIGGTDYLTAIDWLDTVNEEEPKMLPIIKWCIFCLFEGKPNWTDTKFTQAVYANVVRPLEMLVAPT